MLRYLGREECAQVFRKGEEYSQVFKKREEFAQVFRKRRVCSGI